MAGQWIDMHGQRFGRLTVVGKRPKRHAGCNKWRCVCACGQRTWVNVAYLRNGTTRSCGCLSRETTSKMFTKHKKTHTPEYRVWSGMITRCENKNRTQYKDYGGRGIKVCVRWRKSFSTFLADMGPRPSPKHTLDRFPNNDGSYKPSNCRWATHDQQAQNTTRNVFLSLRGETMHLSAWERRLGICSGAVGWRLAHGWSLFNALTTPSTRKAKRP